MATLKEHQAAMVDLLANGSGIPASASRLAHAMHDLIGIVMLQSAARDKAQEFHELFGVVDATTPGLNDKALSKREKALKTDSPAKWPTPAEQRVKELENTVGQLRKQSAKYRATIAGMKADIDSLKALVFAYEHGAEPEQAGCRKEDTQVCDHDGLRDAIYVKDAWIFKCQICGSDITDIINSTKDPKQPCCGESDTQVCEHKWQFGSANTLQEQKQCLLCGRVELDK